jgi:hypothetical protein
MPEVIFAGAAGRIEPLLLAASDHLDIHAIHSHGRRPRHFEIAVTARARSETQSSLWSQSCDRLRYFALMTFAFFGVDTAGCLTGVGAGVVCGPVMTARQAGLSSAFFSAKHLLINSALGTNSRHSRTTSGAQALRCSISGCAMPGTAPAQTARTKLATAAVSLPVLLMIDTPLVELSSGPSALGSASLD